MNHLFTSFALVTPGKTICRTLRHSGFPLFHDAELLKPLRRMSDVTVFVNIRPGCGMIPERRISTFGLTKKLLLSK